jgi:hypothetical protein
MKKYIFFCFLLLVCCKNKFVAVESIQDKNVFEVASNTNANIMEGIIQKNKHISIGWMEKYEKLPKLKFVTISKTEFEKHQSNAFLEMPKMETKGNYFFVGTEIQKHKFKKYKDWGGKESWSGNEFLGFYPKLKLYAITSNSTSESIGFGELLLLDATTDYGYTLVSFGDGSVSLPIPSKKNTYFVYYYNSVYENKNCQIGVLKIGDKKNPARFLVEHASYHSDDFAVEKMVWISDNSFVVKGYEEVNVDGNWIKKFNYYKTTF